LIYRALNELPYLVDLPGSVLVGDSESDIRAGAAAGLRTLLVGGADSSVEPTWRAADLAGVLPLLAGSAIFTRV
jgi:phosphoglycolate phosphatase-like HAD superfamily hydrolase